MQLQHRREASWVCLQWQAAADVSGGVSQADRGTHRRGGVTQTKTAGLWGETFITFIIIIKSASGGLVLAPVYLVIGQFTVCSASVETQPYSVLKLYIDYYKVKVNLVPGQMPGENFVKICNHILYSYLD